MTTTRSAALSNDPVAEAAATDSLLGGSSALSAALAGYFASAGANAGVLLGPLSILVGGLGSGVRAFDGRLRQPGLGAKRPRGFRDEDPVPDAAYVAVPTALSAAAVALAYGEERAIGAVVKHGVLAAQRAGADSRAELLKVVRGMGAAAFASPDFVRPLMHVAGPSEGGQLTSSDLAAVAESIDVPAVMHPEDEGWYEAPWATDGGDTASTPCGSQMVLIAFDARGTAVAVSYQRVRDGIAIDSMELEAPRAAVPVLRGVTRVAPGERIAAPASMAIRFDAGNPVEIIASPAVPRLGAPDLKTPALGIRRDPSQRALMLQRQ